MVVTYASPNRSKVYQTEIPCEADPMPFARMLISEAWRETTDAAPYAEELQYCMLDNNPLMPQD